MSSYVNMILEETDADALDMTPPAAQAVKKTRTVNYSHKEDIQLCISWDNISNDPITGNEQPGKTYWMRIHDHYHANRSFDSDRTPNSLEHRWGTIQRECLKYHACFEDIERRHPSGVPHQEHVLEADALYSNNSRGNKGFAFNHCWLKIRHSPKFLALMPNKRPRAEFSSSPTDGGDVLGEDTTPDSSMPPPSKRPMGRKQAKEKEKKGVQPSPYKEAISDLVLVKEKDSEFKKVRWNETKMLEQQKLYVEQERLKWDQERLKWDKEKELMFCDVSKMDATQKMWVLSQRAQLAAASVAALNNSGSIGDEFGGGSGSIGGEFGGGDGNGVDFSSI